MDGWAAEEGTIAIFMVLERPFFSDGRFYFFILLSRACLGPNSNSNQGGMKHEEQHHLVLVQWRTSQKLQEI
jgi:hypothetical protein